MKLHEKQPTTATFISSTKSSQGTLEKNDRQDYKANVNFSLELANVILSRRDEGGHEGLHVASLLLLYQPGKGYHNQGWVVRFSKVAHRPS